MSSTYKPIRLTGLDIGKYSLKLVEGILKNQKMEIEKTFSIPIPEQVDSTSPESMGKWLSEIWKSNGIRTRSVYLSVPSYKVLVTELNLPEGDDSETIKMIEMQLERELPLPVDSVASDYYVMNTNEMGDRRIMVLSIKNEITDYYKTMIKHAGLSLEGIEVSTLALHKSVQSLELPIQSFVVVNVGYANTEYLVVEKGNLVYSRSSSFGVRLLQETLPASIGKFEQLEPLVSKEPALLDWLNKLSLEIRRNLETYKFNTSKPAPAQIILTGGGSRMMHLPKALESRLEGVNQVLDISNELNTRMPGHKEIAGECLTALGLVLPEETYFYSPNLLLPRLFQKKPFTVTKGYKVAGVAVLIVLVGIGIFFGMLYQKQKELARLQLEYVKYRPLLTHSEQLLGNVTMTRNWKLEQSSILDILNELSILWTDNSYLQVISFDKKEISVNGLASSNQAVAQLLTHINQSNLFTGTKLTFIRASRRNPTYPVEFGLSMKYNKKASIPVAANAGKVQ